MAVGAGVSAQASYVSESVYGTLVTTTKFVEFLSEGLKNDGGTRILSNGLRAGRLAHHRSARGVVHIAGPIEMELPNVNVATWIKHMMGTVVTTGAGPYTHTYTPGDLLGDSMTVQIGKPDVAGTVNPFTYGGVKIASWELAAEVDQYVKLTCNLVAKSETLATGLATASYSASLSPFVFTGAVLSGAGAPTNVNSFTLRADNGLATREGTGSASIREPIATRREYGGSIQGDFDGTTKYADFIAKTERALVATFTSGSDTLTATMNAEFVGESPVVEGPDLLTQPLNFDCISATSDAAALTLVLVNTDTTAA